MATLWNHVHCGAHRIDIAVQIRTYSTTYNAVHSTPKQSRLKIYGRSKKSIRCMLHVRKGAFHTTTAAAHIVLTIWSAKANNIKEASIARRNIFRATPTVLLVFVRGSSDQIYERPHHHTIWLLTDTYIVFSIVAYTHTHTHVHTHIHTL